jgi:hypothetical protein
MNINEFNQKVKSVTWPEAATYIREELKGLPKEHAEQIEQSVTQRDQGYAVDGYDALVLAEVLHKHLVRIWKLKA